MNIPVGFLIAYVGTIIVGGALCIFVGMQTGSAYLAGCIAAITGLIGGFTFARSCRR